ncbi:MAG: hypothetical protein A2172_04070 [Candidatus Woykebacteria bacterium RBG_13_40_15]|uniref:Uncharacterized protein n=1 Tax=Candidatus Woykebacteria bacterium RBG_13_40_15 TaxID=1802593 RepID=A0A1G1W7Q0_9BACT|nr:MAG: hypothetical protein A2172_04070 [Candidatus Woykebacteria bacterium RBG_13_40_15]
MKYLMFFAIISFTLALFAGFLVGDATGSDRLGGATAAGISAILLLVYAVGVGVNDTIKQLKSQQQDATKQI